MVSAGLVALAYLSGSLPFGLWLVLWKTGTDVRTQGSGNIGATNVARAAGKPMAALVLTLDALKGALPVWLAQTMLPDDKLMHVLVGVVAFLGHVFPVWLRFRGGKGVATALGVLIVLQPWPAFAGFIVWSVVIATVRVSSVGSLLGSWVAVAVSWWLPYPVEYRMLALLLAVAVLVTHRSNIRRMMKREEKKV